MPSADTSRLKPSTPQQEMRQKAAGCTMHGYFLKPLRVGQPVSYRIGTLREGGSFATRYLEAVQNDVLSFRDDVLVHIGYLRIMSTRCPLLRIPRVPMSSIWHVDRARGFWHDWSDPAGARRNAPFHVSRVGPCR